jgi:hypothetical protein
MKFRALVLVFVLGLVGCRNQPLNPPRLVMDSETDASIQLFVEASILMLQAYGFETIPYEQIQFRSERAGFAAIILQGSMRATSISNFSRTTWVSPLPSQAASWRW